MDQDLGPLPYPATEIQAAIGADPAVTDQEQHPKHRPVNGGGLQRQGEELFDWRGPSFGVVDHDQPGHRDADQGFELLEVVVVGQEPGRPPWGQLGTHRRAQAGLPGRRPDQRSPEPPPDHQWCR
jgi:hypothetical protein